MKNYKIIEKIDFRNIKKPTVLIYVKICIKLLFLCLLFAINLILKFNQKASKKENKLEYFCCFCAMGKRENLYSRELIEYYRGIGVEKFVFGDNNLPNTEKLSDVLEDYIKEGLVDILEIFGSTIGQGEFYGVMYDKYKKKCKWLTFFDVEFLIIVKELKLIG